MSMVVVGHNAPSALQPTVIEAVTRTRTKDVSGLAGLDVEVMTHRHGGGKAEQGAQWLITNFADDLQGPVKVEIRQDEDTGVDWNACLSYGAPERRLRLGFVEYGRKGLWPDPNGGGKYSFPVNA